MRYFITYEMNGENYNDIIEEYPINWVLNKNKKITDDIEISSVVEVNKYYTLLWWTTINEDLIKDI